MIQYQNLQDVDLRENAKAWTNKKCNVWEQSCNSWQQIEIHSPSAGL